MAVYEPALIEPAPTASCGREKLVLDKEGQPIRMAEPTFSDEDWTLIKRR